jgi:AraC-like DNA-binding protein
MRAVASLHRYPPGEVLEGIVDWLWAVAWELPPGVERVQKVLTHPGSHLSVGTVDRVGNVHHPAGARVYGVNRRLDRRRLVGQGWTVAAKTSGGLGVLTGRAAHTLTDAELPLEEVLGLRDVAATVAAAGCEEERIRALREVLERTVAARPEHQLGQARQVTAVASVAEHDRSVVRVEQLAIVAGVGVRTLQRMFAQHLGVSPAWVIRRWRLVEAADRAAAGDTVAWAELAVELGYADQSHLVRDFKAHLGTTPAAYARTPTAVP